MPDPAPRRRTFPRSHRLKTRRDFARVYAARAWRWAGPLRVHAAPNERDHDRLGLSVSARAGNAVTRNRIKRRLREAFRLLQHDLPPGYDLVIVVKRHDPLTTPDYQRLLADAMRRLDRHWHNHPSPAEP